MDLDLGAVEVAEVVEKVVAGRGHLRPEVRNVLVRELVRIDKGQDLAEPREDGVLALERVFAEKQVEHRDRRVPLRAEVCVRHRDLVPGVACADAQRRAGTVGWGCMGVGGRAAGHRGAHSHVREQGVRQGIRRREEVVAAARAIGAQPIPVHDRHPCARAPAPASAGLELPPLAPAGPANNEAVGRAAGPARARARGARERGRRRGDALTCTDARDAERGTRERGTRERSSSARSSSTSPSEQTRVRFVRESTSWVHEVDSSVTISADWRGPVSPPAGTGGMNFLGGTGEVRLPPQPRRGAWRSVSALRLRSPALPAPPALLSRCLTCESATATCAGRQSMMGGLGNLGNLASGMGAVGEMFGQQAAPQAAAAAAAGGAFRVCWQCGAPHARPGCGAVLLRVPALNTLARARARAEAGDAVAQFQRQKKLVADALSVTERLGKLVDTDISDVPTPRSAGAVACCTWGSRPRVGGVKLQAVALAMGQRHQRPRAHAARAASPSRGC